MTDSLTAMADVMRAAEQQGYRQGRMALHGFLADEVDMRRVPALPQDGRRDRATLLQMWRNEATTYETTLENFHQEDVVVTVRGENIESHRVLCAIDVDGSALRVPIDQIFTVRDGHVISAEVHIDAELCARLLQIVHDGGLPHPDAPEEVRRIIKET